MKAFQFRLEQALRWRSGQRDLERARVLVAAQRLAGLREAIETHSKELTKGASQLNQGIAVGHSFELWAAFTDRARRRIKVLGAQASEAEKALAVQTLVLVEADRKLRLLENLKENAQMQWRDQFNRELEAFAGESFLVRIKTDSAP